MGYVFIIIGTLLSSSAHICLKRYAMAKNLGTATGLFDHRFVSGLTLFATSVLCGLAALYYLEFSQFYSLTALNFLFISILSCYFLGEKLDRYKIIGNLIIIIGVFVYCL